MVTSEIDISRSWCVELLGKFLRKQGDLTMSHDVISHSWGGVCQLLKLELYFIIVKCNYRAHIQGTCSCWQNRNHTLKFILNYDKATKI